jgi:hypothetical protein
LGQQVFQNGWVLLESIDAGIGVKEKLHRSKVLFSPLSWGGLVWSSRTPRKRLDVSRWPFLDRFYDDLAPFPCTRTVSVPKQNSFGSRTAWLLPVQNTLALLDFTPAC